MFLLDFSLSVLLWEVEGVSALGGLLLCLMARVNRLHVDLVDEELEVSIIDLLFQFSLLPDVAQIDSSVDVQSRYVVTLFHPLLAVVYEGFLVIRFYFEGIHH